MKALASDAAQPAAVVWAVLLGCFALCCVALAGLTARLHRLKRTGPRQVCFLLLLSFVLRTAWLAWYYFLDTDLDAGAKQRSPLQTLEVVSRLNLNLTFTAVSSLVTLWLRALSADPLQKARIKRFHQSYNILLYTGSFALELLSLVGGETLKGLTFFSTLWTSGMALGYLLGAMGFGLHLSRGQRQHLHGLDLYRYIRKYTRKLQSFTLVVAATYLAFLALFVVSMLGNGREGTNEVTRQSLPLHEAALGVELLLALLIILGVRQPLGGPTPLSISAATVVAGSNGADAAKGESATLVWTSPRNGDNKARQKKGRVALDDDLEQDSLRAPLLGQQDRRPQSPKSGPNSPKGPPSGGSVARVVGGDGQNGGSSRR